MALSATNLAWMTCPIHNVHHHHHNHSHHHHHHHNHQPAMYICCGWMLFLTKRSLEKHLWSAAHDKGIPCQICRACFLKQTTLDQHYKAGYHLIPARPPPRVCCFPCVLDFADQSEFDRHVLDRHRVNLQPTSIMHKPPLHPAAPAPPPIRRVPVPPPPQPVSPTSTPTPEPASTASTVPPETQQFICVLCSTATYFRTLSELDAHIDSPFGHKWHCNECGTSCDSEYGLDIHLLGFHPGPQTSENQATEAPPATTQPLAPPQPAPLAGFYCGPCASGFADQLEFDAHLSTSRRHNRSCEQCTAVLANGFFLQEHVRLFHTTPATVQVLNEFPRRAPTPAPPTVSRSRFTCTPCASEFRNQFELNTHLSTSRRHNRSCKHCPAVLDRTSMKEHVRLCHTEPPAQVQVSIEFPRQAPTPTPAPPTVSLPSFSCAPCASHFPNQLELDTHLSTSSRHNISSQSAAAVDNQSSEQPRHLPLADDQSPMSGPAQNDAPAQQVPRTNPPADVGIAVIHPAQPASEIIVNPDSSDRSPAPQPPRTDPFEHFPTRMPQPTAHLFHCTPCSRDFKDQHGLTSHLASQAHNISCRLCGDHCGDRPSLREHLVLHHGARAPLPRFHCVPCNRGFTTQTSFDRHVESGLHRLQLVCDVCTGMFSTRVVLDLHRAADHPGAAAWVPESVVVERVKCLLCRRTFVAQYALDQHLRSNAHLNRRGLRNKGDIPVRA